MSRNVLVSLGLFLPLQPLAAETFHVDPSVATPGDGSSWAAAFDDLPAALAAASPGDEIWVAAGTYKPGGDRTDTFQLKTGVAILGGFPGGGGDGTLSARNPDPATNLTILSGDIGVPDDASDNSFHVVTGSGTTGTAILDGFTIRDGHADGDPALRQNLGGGILCDGSGTPQFRNLLVTRNQTDGVGGAVYLNAAPASFTDVVFLENRTTATGTGVTGEGGAIYLNNCSPVFTRGAFLGNSALLHGGALSLHTSNPLFTDVIFVGNLAGNSAVSAGVGGALYHPTGSIPQVIHCSLVENHAKTGGAIWGSGPVVKNSIVWGNFAPASPQIDGSLGAGSTRNLIEGFTYNGGSVIASTDPLFQFKPFTLDGDWATWDDNHYGDLHLRAGSPAIDSGNGTIGSPAADADGNPRPIDGDLDGNPDLDLGPFEFSTPPPIPPDGEIHRWTFNGDTSDSVGNAELALHGGASLREGHLILNGTDAFAVSTASSPLALAERTFVAWVDPANLTQQAGGVLTIVRELEGVTDTFDGIVYAEQVPGQWMNGSNSLARSVATNGGIAESVSGSDKVMIAITYGPGNAINLFRNGQPYNTLSATKGTLVGYPVGETRFHLGQRHPGSGNPNRFFAGRIDEARVYNRPLSAGEIADLHTAGPVPDTPPTLLGGTNLAAGAIARQSATVPTAFPVRTDAGVVLDGITTSGNSTAATGTPEEPAAWVEVELPEDAQVSRVEIANSSANRSRLRDITLELRDATGNVLATSPLLNPENTGHIFPNGPPALAHLFNSTASTRIIRVIRTPDPDLSGTSGQGSPSVAEASYLEIAELRVFGENVAPAATVRAFSATFDSRRADPDPVAQLWFDTETERGSDASPADGLLDSDKNVGIVIDGEEAVWQVLDQSRPASYDNPWNRNLLDNDELLQLYDLGWSFSATVKALAPSNDGGYSGYVGWGFTAGKNPGWDIAANAAARIGFAVGINTGDNSFYITPESAPKLDLPAGSADDYHTITAVCPPRSTVYEWFLDGVSQGTLDFATVDVGGLTADNLSFGSGRGSNFGGTTNWKQVSLETVPPPPPPSLDGLVFYLPFEPGTGGNETLIEKSQKPGEKPDITSRSSDAGVVSPIFPGKIATGAEFGTGLAGEDAFLDATGALDQLAHLDSGTISLWVKPRTTNGAGSLITFYDSAQLGISSDLQISGTNLWLRTRANGTEFGDPLFVDAPTIRDGDWHHVAVSITPTSSRMYYDGQMIAESSPGNATGFTSALPSIDRFQIGIYNHPAFPAESSGAYTGKMDELAIWNRGLSDDEIAALFHTGYLGAPLTRDVDGDGLNNAEEMSLGTRDDHTDSDGDTIPDAAEIIDGTDPAKPDTDGDGIPDNEETANGTSPLLADSDGDGFSDSAETQPARLVSRSFSRAPDGGITFIFQAYGTVTDIHIESSTDLTDFAHLPGAIIVHTGGGLYTATATPPPGQRFFRGMSAEGTATDPLDPNSFQDLTSPDTDGDGLSDDAEARLGTRSDLADTDADDFNDFVEVLLGTDPLDPASNPGIADADDDGLTDAQEAALGTRPDLADTDNDGFSDQAEVNSGSDPKSDTSTPGDLVLRGGNFVLLENGDISFTFTVEGTATNLRLQSSPDLQAFPDLAGATITPLGGGRYTAIATPPSGHRYFRAAADDGAGGTATTISVDFDLPEGALTAEEGETFVFPVIFSSPFTGYLSYQLNGITPQGKALPAITGGIELSGATASSISLMLFNDLTAGAAARYTLTLTGRDGLVSGLASAATLLVEDDDALWNGTLGIEGEQLNFVLESLTDGTTTLQHLSSTETSSLIPLGTFPVTASFGESTFSCTSGNIPLLRSLPTFTGGHATISRLQLAADSGQSGQSVAPAGINGTATIDLTPAAGNPATLAATFNLQRRPPPPPSTDLDLSPAAP